MKKIILIILFICSITYNINAQVRTGTLRGIVTDSTNGEALAYGNVFIKEINKGSTTDKRGFFIIPAIPPNKTYTVISSYVGYETSVEKYFITSGRITDVKIKLVPKSIELGTVEKVGEKTAEKNAPNVSLEKLSVRDLETLPKGVESDIFRSLQYIPGVQTTSDISARYYVRGSASNQNLVMLDGIPIYNPFHALGMFSVIDPEMINSLEFYKGGFTAEYGSRLSSVLNMITKDGNKNRFSATASSSFLTGKAVIEAPYSNGSLIITGRKSFSNSILKKFLNEKNVPIDFFDASFKLNFQDNNFMKDARFMIHGFASNDKVINLDPFKEDFDWRNRLIGIRYFQISDSPLFYEVNFYLSRFEGEVRPNLSKARYRRNEFNEVTLKMNFNYVYDSGDELDLGFQIMEARTTLLIENIDGIIGDLGSNGSNISVFGKYKFLRYDNFGLDAGTRINATRLAGGGGDEITYEPRISMTYRPFDWLSWKSAWGIYQQDVTTLSDDNEIISLFEPWTITPLYLKPSRAIHYVMGLEIKPVKNILFNFETYYKSLQNIAVLNEKKYFPNDPELKAVQGTAYGFEFFLRYNRDPFSATISYSLAYATQRDEGKVYSPRYDSRHTGNIILEYSFGDGWHASTTWRFASGLPFTQILSYYDKLFVDNLYTEGYALNAFQPYTLLAGKNLERLPSYHRLDFNLSKHFKIDPLDVYLDISLINIYDRKNIFYFERDTGKRVNMLPFLPTATLKIKL